MNDADCRGVGSPGSASSPPFHGSAPGWYSGWRVLTCLHVESTMDGPDGGSSTNEVFVIRSLHSFLPWLDRTALSDEGLERREPSCLSPSYPSPLMIPWKARCTMCWQCSEHQRREWPRPGHTYFSSADRLVKRRPHARPLFSSRNYRAKLVNNTEEAGRAAAMDAAGL